MNDNIQKVIDTIKDQHIVPEPKWKFLLSVYGRWFVFVGMVSLGAIAVLIMIVIAARLDWDIYMFARQNHMLYFLSLLPYAWIGILFILTVLSFFELRKMETGYRYSRWAISMMVIGGIAFAGIIFSFFHFGEMSNMFLESHAPYYRQHLVVTKESQWSRPEQGFLSGYIVSVSESAILIDDVHNKRWTVVMNDVTSLKPRVSLEIHERIKIIGTANGDMFHADEIRPWEGKGMMKNKIR